MTDASVVVGDTVCIGYKAVPIVESKIVGAVKAIEVVEILVHAIERKRIT